MCIRVQTVWRTQLKVQTGDLRKCMIHPPLRPQVADPFPMRLRRCRCRVTRSGSARLRRDVLRRGLTESPVTSVRIPFLPLYVVKSRGGVGPRFCILVTAGTRVCKYCCMPEKTENVEVNKLIY